METQEHPQNSSSDPKQALADMLKRPSTPLRQPPITQRLLNQPPPAPAKRASEAANRNPKKSSASHTSSSASSQRAGSLDDVPGSHRRTAAPTTTLPAPHREFAKLISESEYAAPRASGMMQSQAAIQQPRRPPRYVEVSHPRSAPSLNGLFNGNTRIVMLVAAISIGILLYFTGPEKPITYMGRGLSQILETAPLTSNLAKALAPPQAELPTAPNGEHSILGGSTITADQIDAVLTTYNSPAAGTGKIWMELGKQYNINPAYALAFFIHESSAATASGWAGWKPDGNSTHNIGNIICAGYATCYNRFRDYPGWQEGIADWYRLISVEYVDGRGAFTVEQIIPIYAPSFENNVPAYVQAVTDLVQQWHR